MSTVPTYQYGETPWVRLKSLTQVSGGTVVDTLDPGESIVCEITDETGIIVATLSTPTAVTYEPFVINGRSVGAWAAIAKQTPGGAVLDVGRYAIRWTATIGGGVAIEDDALRIKA